MKLGTLLGLGVLATLVLAACGGDEETSSSAIVSTSTPFPDNGYQFEILEVHLGENGYVTLHNYTDTPASLKGLFLCQPPDCVELPEEEVAAGNSALVAVGSGNGLDNAVVTEAELTLEPANGELALFASDDVSDSGQIRSYLEWGATPHEGTAIAVEAGLWAHDSYAPTSESATRLYRNDQGLWLFE